MTVIEFQFDERKATQAAALIISKRGGAADTLALVKLLYIVDKFALKSWGRSITGDSYYSLPHGPVGTVCCDLVRHGGWSGGKIHQYWLNHIKRIGNSETHEIAAEIDLGALSDDEVKLIERVCDRLQKFEGWDLRQLTHARRYFPEWTDPVGGAKAFSINNMLALNGVSAEKMAKFEDSSELRAIMQELITEHVKP